MTPRRSLTRIICGALGIIAVLAIIIEILLGAVANRDGSAVQMTELFTEGIFLVLVVLTLVSSVSAITRRD